MRRFYVGSVFLGLLVTTVGCQHIGGTNDVYHHPDNAVINTGSGNPYLPTGNPLSGFIPTPAEPVNPVGEKPAEKPMAMPPADKPMDKPK